MEDPLASILNFHEAKSVGHHTGTGEHEEREHGAYESLEDGLQREGRSKRRTSETVQETNTPTLIEIPSCMMIPTPTKSSITESNSPSYVSSPVDSLMEAVSPRDFSNMIVDSSHNNMAYHLNQPLVQNTRVSQRRTCDVGDEVIEHLAKRKTLPQKDTPSRGPTSHVAKPPSSQTIETPCLKVQDFASKNVNAFNSLQKPSLAFASSRTLQPSVFNVSAVNDSALQMISNASCKNLAPSRIPQSHQYLLRN
ncbi:hypothetical protein ACSQ67_010895 [Phaseolus vulgaris]